MTEGGQRREGWLYLDRSGITVLWTLIQTSVLDNEEEFGGGTEQGKGVPDSRNSVSSNLRSCERRPSNPQAYPSGKPDGGLPLPRE